MQLNDEDLLLIWYGDDIIFANLLPTSGAQPAEQCMYVAYHSELETLVVALEKCPTFPLIVAMFTDKDV